MNILMNGEIIDSHVFGRTKVYQVLYEGDVYYLAVENNEIVYCMMDD